MGREDDSSDDEDAAYTFPLWIPKVGPEAAAPEWILWVYLRREALGDDGGILHDRGLGLLSRKVLIFLELQDGGNEEASVVCADLVTIVMATSCYGLGAEYHPISSTKPRSALRRDLGLDDYGRAALSESSTLSRLQT